MVDEQAILDFWVAEGFSTGEWSDPPGAEWKDNCHMVEERMVLLEGELELEIGDRRELLKIGRECRIPANTVHTVRNPGNVPNRWLYGYGSTLPSAHDD